MFTRVFFRNIFFCLFFVIGTFLAALFYNAWKIPPLDPKILADHSPLVLDKEGRILRVFARGDGIYRLPVRIEEVDQRYITLLLHYEDKRFFSHIGIDFWALGRAFGQMLLRQKIISGGSTLTMQVARLIEQQEKSPKKTRGISQKWRQMARALALEWRYSKKEILELYLNLAPFGGNLEGVRTASLAYFGKEPRRLLAGEAGLLVALPQAPSARRPDRFLEEARHARISVLTQTSKKLAFPLCKAHFFSKEWFFEKKIEDCFYWVKQSHPSSSAALFHELLFFSPSDLERGKSEIIPPQRRAFPFHAAHLAENLVARFARQRIIFTKINLEWQKQLEQLVKERASFFGSPISIALLVVEHKTGAIRVAIGGADYFDAARKGNIDLTRALRSPGSTLKPFIYGLSFDAGLAHPETFLEDRPRRFAAYAPDNFDFQFHGVVSARKALQLSLNLPAIELLQLFGAQRLFSRLREVGARIMIEGREAPGLAIGLGGIGISLRDLTMLYAGVARGGAVIALQEVEEEKPASSRGFMSPVAAWYIHDILLGAPPPENAEEGKIAYKTGTSYGFRDAFAFGFDAHHTIGVWVGRADNAPIPGFLGRKIAAPILFQAFSRLPYAAFTNPPPQGAIIASNAMLPPPLRHIRQDIPKSLPFTGESALQIAFPPDGAILEPDNMEEKQSIMLKINGGTPPFTFLVDGIPLTTPTMRRELEFWPEGQGFMRLAVMDAQGQSDHANFRIRTSIDLPAEIKPAPSSQ